MRGRPSLFGAITTARRAMLMRGQVVAPWRPCRASLAVVLIPLASTDSVIRIRPIHCNLFVVTSEIHLRRHVGKPADWTLASRHEALHRRHIREGGLWLLRLV